MTNFLRQLRTILPGAPIERCEGPCAAQLFIASRIKRQGSAVPFPRKNDPIPGVDTHFGAQLLRLAAERADHPPPAAPEHVTLSPNAGL